MQFDPSVVHNNRTSFKAFYRGANGHHWYVPDGGGKGWVGAPVDLGGAYPTAATRTGILEPASGNFS